MGEERDERFGEGGFTLLELLVVLTVIGIIVSIAVPTFLSARSTAQRTAAQADLRTALTAATTAYVDTPDQTFAETGMDQLSSAEPAIHWVADHATQPGTLAVFTTDGAGQVVVDENGTPAIGFASYAADGTCWYAFQSDNHPPLYGRGPAAGGCDASQAADYSSSPSIPS